MCSAGIRIILGPWIRIHLDEKYGPWSDNIKYFSFLWPDPYFSKWSDTDPLGKAEEKFDPDPTTVFITHGYGSIEKKLHIRIRLGRNPGSSTLLRINECFGSKRILIIIYSRIRIRIFKWSDPSTSNIFHCYCRIRIFLREWIRILYIWFKSWKRTVNFFTIFLQSYTLCIFFLTRGLTRGSYSFWLFE